MGENAFLGYGHEKGGKHPLTERHLGALEYGSDLHGELLTAISTLAEARAMGFALQLLALLGPDTVRQVNAISPARRLKIF